MESVPTSTINPEGVEPKSHGDLSRRISVGSSTADGRRSGKRALKGSQPRSMTRDSKRRKAENEDRYASYYDYYYARAYTMARNYAPRSSKSACSPTARHKLSNARFPRDGVSSLTGRLRNPRGEDPPRWSCLHCNTFETIVHEFCMSLWQNKKILMRNRETWNFGLDRYCKL